MHRLRNTYSCVASEDVLRRRCIHGLAIVKMLKFENGAWSVYNLILVAYVRVNLDVSSAVTYRPLATYSFPTIRASSVSTLLLHCLFDQRSSTKQLFVCNRLQNH